jgi:hypothetical protein
MRFLFSCARDHRVVAAIRKASLLAALLLGHVDTEENEVAAEEDVDEEVASADDTAWKTLQTTRVRI